MVPRSPAPPLSDYEKVDIRVLGGFQVWADGELVEDAFRSGATVARVPQAACRRGSPGSGWRSNSGWAVGGVVSRVADDETAVGDSREGFEMSITVGWPSPDTDPNRHKGWVRDAWEALRPYGEGVYANFISDEGTSGVEYAYGPRFQRLQALKAIHDPDNFFHRNNNIAPSAGA